MKVILDDPVFGVREVTTLYTQGTYASVDLGMSTGVVLLCRIFHIEEAQYVGLMRYCVSYKRNFE